MWVRDWIPRSYLFVSKYSYVGCNSLCITLMASASSLQYMTIDQMEMASKRHTTADATLNID